MARRSNNGIETALVVAAILGFLWSLFKYPIATIIAVNIITLIFFPNNFGTIFGFSLLVGLIYFLIKKSNQTSTKQAHKNKYNENPQRENKAQVFMKERKLFDDPEIKALYRKLMHKYHPDHGQNEGDDKLRNELTIKINRAYQDGDIETLKLFE